MATIDTIKAILQDKLDIDPSKVDGNSTFESLNVDSLDMVELICELEDQLNIDFGEPEGLNTIDELVAYIDSLKSSVTENARHERAFRMNGHVRIKP